MNILLKMRETEETHISYEDALDKLAPITLEEMDRVQLMNRIDSKYLTDEATLVKILDDAARENYSVFTTGGLRITPYDSIYYDTPQLKMFLDHHNRRSVRQKIRTRSYLTSGDTYLEIKKKNNKGRTKKKRTRILFSDLKDFRGNAGAVEYLAANSAFTAGEISPVLETAFHRITLVNAAQTERLTIDTMLHFKNFRTGKDASLKNAVIIELKQDGRAVSQMKGIFLRHRVKPIRVSKYCIAVTLTDHAVKSNRFKNKVRKIEKTINQKITES